MRALVYAAVSTEEQATEDKGSIPQQLELCRQACRGHDWTVTKEIVVAGHSRNYHFLHELMRQVRELLADPDLYLSWAEDAHGQNHSAERLAALDAQIETVEDRYERQYAAYSVGAIDLDRLLDHKDTRDEALEMLRREAEQLRRWQERSQAVYRQLLESADLVADLESMGAAALNRLYSRFIEAIRVWEDDTVEIEWRV